MAKLTGGTSLVTDNQSVLKINTLIVEKNKEQSIGMGVLLDANFVDILGSREFYVDSTIVQLYFFVSSVLPQRLFLIYTTPKT